MESILYFVLYSINTSRMWSKYGQTQSILPADLEASENFKNFPLQQLPLGDYAVQLSYVHDAETAVAERLNVQFLSWIGKVEKLG